MLLTLYTKIIVLPIRTYCLLSSLSCTHIHCILANIHADQQGKLVLPASSVDQHLLPPVHSQRCRSTLSTVIFLEMSSESGANFTNMYGNVIIFQGQPIGNHKRAYTDALQTKPPAQAWKKPRSENSRQEPPLSKAKVPKICFFQETCRRPPGQCHFKHLPEEKRAGKRHPYKLCHAYPQCTRDPCPYMHWTGDEDDDSEYEMPASGLPPLNFTSKGGIIPPAEEPADGDRAPQR